MIPTFTTVGTTFDQQSLRTIVDQSNPAHFAGHYRPQFGNLNVFNGWTPLGSASGAWFRRAESSPMVKIAFRAVFTPID